MKNILHTNTQIINFGIIAVILLSIFVVSELLYRRLKLKGELTRKFTHISSGIVCMFFPLLFDNHWFVLVLTICFFPILYISKKYKQLPSIHDVKRKTTGSYIFPITVYFCFLVYLRLQNPVFYYIPLITLSISDPIAAFSGSIWKMQFSEFGVYNTSKYSKTFFGSFMFFISTFLLSIVFLQLFTVKSTENVVFVTLCISIVATYTEAVSYKGLDNITVPLVIVITMICLQGWIA